MNTSQPLSDMSQMITRFYLPPDRGDVSAIIPAKLVPNLLTAKYRIDRLRWVEFVGMIAFLEDN